jgi:hypothetical protein
MKLFFLLIITSFSLASCMEQNDNRTESNIMLIKKAEAKNTIDGTLKAKMEYDFQFYDEIPLTDNAYFISKHKDEILKTFEIVEKDTIPGKDIVLVFYRYSVGADIVRETSYLKKIDDKWYIHTHYYSSYDNDPYKNGKPIEGKALLEKKSKWEEESKDIWWKLN